MSERTPQTWLGMARWAERKADEAAASTAPWAMGNLRTYQGLMSQWLGEYHKACRLAGLEPE
jgi:hypothetical protein